MTGTEPELSDAEYQALLRELEQQFPVPTWDEVKLEWKWLHETSANNTFDPEYKYGGLNVAIYNQRVVGTDTHWMRLRIRLSRELGVHPERIVVTYFPDGTEGISPARGNDMTGTEPTAEEYLAELRELEKQFPTPTWEEVLPDWKWVHAWMADPRRDPENRYGDRWIAVLNQTIVGVGYDPLALRIVKSRELGVHPERLVLTYALGDWKGPW